MMICVVHSSRFSKQMQWWFVWYTQVDLEMTRNGDLWYAIANKSRQKIVGCELPWFQALRPNNMFTTQGCEVPMFA